MEMNDQKEKQLERTIKIKRLELEKDSRELDELRMKEKQLRQDLDQKRRVLQEKTVRSDLLKESEALLDVMLEQKIAETEKVVQDWCCMTQKVFEMRLKFAEDVNLFARNSENAVARKSEEASNKRQKIEKLKDDLQAPKEEGDRLEKELKELKERQSLVRQLKTEKDSLSNPDNDPEIKIAYRLIEKLQIALDELTTEEMATEPVQEVNENRPSIYDFITHDDNLITEPTMYGRTNVRPRLMYAPTSKETDKI